MARRPKDDVRRLALEKLKESGLDERDAKRLGIEFLDAAQTRSSLPKNRDVPEQPSLKLQYHDVTGKPRDGIFRVRVLGEPNVTSFADVAKPKRYIQPFGAPPAAYLPRSVDWDKVFKDPAVDVVLTEGELKAACACKRGFPTIGLGGVDSWASKMRGLSFLPELERMKFVGRTFTIVYDSDASRKPAVAWATVRLSQSILERGGVVNVAHLPDVDGLKKTGLDDYLVRRKDADFEELLGEATTDELTRKLWDFNSRFVFIVNPGFVFDEEPPEELPPGVDVRFAPSRKQPQLPPGDFRASLFANVWAKKQVGVDKEGRPKIQDVKVAAEWIEWPMRRTYRRVTYVPGAAKVVGDAYNAWSGWGVDEREGDVSPWNDLLDHLARDQPAFRRWFEQWLGYPIAHAGAKLNTAVCLWSTVQGIGKSVVGKTVGAIYGRDNYSEISQKELDGDFNTWAVNKQFVMVDDMSSADSRAKADILKKLITEDWLQANQKNIDLYDVPDCNNFYLTSNRPNTLKVDDADRRFAIGEVELAPCGKRHTTTEEAKRCASCVKFWDRYYGWLRNGGPSALMWHLRRLDYSDFEPKGWAPMTAAKEEMIATSKNEVAQWVDALRTSLQDGDREALWDQNGPLTRDLYTSSELLAMFERDRKDTRPSQVIANTMGAVLKEHGFPRASTSPLRVNGRTAKYYVLRNVNKWLRASRADMEKHLEAEFKKESAGGESKTERRTKTRKY